MLNDAFFTDILPLSLSAQKTPLKSNLIVPKCSMQTRTLSLPPDTPFLVMLFPNYLTRGHKGGLLFCSKLSSGHPRSAKMCVISTMKRFLANRRCERCMRLLFIPVFVKFVAHVFSYYNIFIVYL